MASRRARLWRTVLSWALLLLFCVAAPVALVAGWARQTVSDPEAYARAVRETADDPRVQEGLTQAVAQRAQAVLAGENPTATEAIQARLIGQALGDAAGEVVASPEFPDVWETANRDAYQSLVTDSPGEWGAPVVLDLGPLAGPLQDEVAALDLDLPPDLTIEPRDMRLELLGQTTADQVRRALQQISLVFWGALAVTVVSLLLAIAIAPDRLRAAARAAFGLAIAMVALMTLLLVTTATMARSAGQNGGDVALIAVMDAVSQGLRLAAIGLALGGLLLAGIFFGLSALARSTRRGVAG